MSFSLLGEELNKKVANDKSLKKQLEATNVLEVAQGVLEEVFGVTQALHAKPLFVKNRTLTISCISAQVAQEIRLHQKILVDKINDALETPEIDRIRYLA